MFARKFEYRQTLFQEIAHHRHAKQVASRLCVVSLGCFPTDRWPVCGQTVVATKPCQSHQVDLLVLGQFVNERMKPLLHGRIGVLVFLLVKFVDDEMDDIERYLQYPRGLVK